MPAKTGHIVYTLCRAHGIHFSLVGQLAEERRAAWEAAAGQGPAPQTSAAFHVSRPIVKGFFSSLHNNAARPAGTMASMKLLVFSDIHGDYAALERLMKIEADYYF